MDAAYHGRAVCLFCAKEKQASRLFYDFFAILREPTGLNHVGSQLLQPVDVTQKLCIKQIELHLE